MRLVTGLLLLTGLAFAHTAEPAGAPPSDVPAAFTGMLQKDGVRVKDGAKNVMELWFRSSVPSGAKTAEDSVSLATVPHGTLLGVVRFTERGSDRRGQPLKPGIYTMRLSYFPPDGNHQGVSPVRDFVLLTPIAEDKDVAATPDYNALVQMSVKSTGTAHPAVLSIWRVDKDFKVGVAKEGEQDWVLQHQVGDIPLAMIVGGIYNH